MARKNDSPQKAAMREMMRGYLKNNDISIKNVHIPQELRIRSGGTERHSASS